VLKARPEPWTAEEGQRKATCFDGRKREKTRPGVVGKVKGKERRNSQGEGGFQEKEEVRWLRALNL